MKNNSKKDRRRLLGISMRVVLTLVVVGLLVVPVAVQADLKATAVVYAWDYTALKFQNSNVIIPWDGTWIPFLHQLNFDTDLWTVADPTAECVANGGATRWAGEMFYGLYNVDNAPLGAPGFQESAVWSLISCDRNEDLTFDNADLSYDLQEIAPQTQPPPHYYRPTRDFLPYECTLPGDPNPSPICRVVSANVPTPCTTGNCLLEIVTTIKVNLDTDCDGAVDTDPVTGLSIVPLDAKGHPERLCFYAEARTPRLDEQVDANGNPLPTWSNPLQARISTVGGDKTVNFNVAPTAIELAAFDAAAQANGVLLTWETANEIDNLGFNIYRADSQVGQLVKINANLIASQNPGSVVGAAYSFLDESAAPGATYYYWLEDIDASGTATKHGPVTAKMAAAKALPGRPRPAPMPSNAF